MIKVYTMSVEPLVDNELFELAQTKVDTSRLEKVKKKKSYKDKCLCLGVGLLLQYAVSWALEKRQDSSIYQELDIRNVLEGLKALLCLTFRYGESGKPYLENYPELYFSLSHSEDYVVCAISDKEIGVDIQKEKDNPLERVVARFFSTKENIIYQNLSSNEEKRSWFYRTWSAKEAYIKLTGKGLGQGLSTFSVDFERMQIVDDNTTDVIEILEFKQIPFYHILLSFYT